jgi:hypothetical protein
MLHVKKIIDVVQPTILQSIEQSKNHLKYNMSIKLLQISLKGFLKSVYFQIFIYFFSVWG